MKDEKFIEQTQAAIEFVKPVMRLLRVADRTSSQHAIVWERMASLDEHYSQLMETYEGLIPMEQVETTHEFVVNRWAYLHDATHSVAYALNPHFHSIDVGAEESVMTDLESVFEEFYSDPEEQVKVGLEFQDYKTKGHVHWKKPLVWAQAKHMSPWQFWNMHGHCCPLLRPVAMVVLHLNHAAGGCESNWSTHDFLCGKRRASTSANTLSKEVYYFTNQRMVDKRFARGKKRQREVKYYDDDGKEIAFPLWGDKDADSQDESD
jgi:hypothetical protein